MALHFDGTGYLKFTGAIAANLPLTMFAHARGAGGSTFLMGTGRDNGADPLYCRLTKLGSSPPFMAATHRTSGSSRSASSTTGNEISSTVYKPVAGIFLSTGTHLRLGSPSVLFSEATARTNTLNTHEQFIVGADGSISTPTTGLWVGDIGEVALWSSDLSVEDHALLAGGALPETVSPGTLIDVWPMLTLEGSDNYVGIINSNVLVSSGSGITLAAEHPVTRSSSDATAPGATLTGTSTITPGAASGESPGVAPGATLTGTSTIAGGGATGGGSGATLVTYPFVNNTELTDPVLYANQTGVTVHIYSDTDGALVVTKTGQTTNASGIATITDALLAGVTTYAYWAKFPDGEFGADRKATE